MDTLEDKIKRRDRLILCAAADGERPSEESISKGLGLLRRFVDLSFNAVWINNLYEGGIIVEATLPLVGVNVSLSLANNGLGDLWIDENDRDIVEMEDVPWSEVFSALNNYLQNHVDITSNQS